jgi:hypothetical protein
LENFERGLFKAAGIRKCKYILIFLFQFRFFSEFFYRPFFGIFARKNAKYIIDATLKGLKFTLEKKEGVV